MGNDYIVTDGIDYKDALNKALEQVGLLEEQVIVEVLEEKKSSFFKKGYVKLKVSVRSEPEQAIDLSEEKKREDNHKSHGYTELEEQEPFMVDFRPDGVYLSVFFRSNNMQNILDKVIEYLNIKQVKDFELSIIQEYISNKQEDMVKIAPFQEEILIDSYLNIEIAPDKMKAWVQMTKPYGGRLLTEKDIIEELTARQIVYGIDHGAIKELLRKKLFNKKQCIAQGKAPIDGNDASLIYHIDIDLEKKPHILEDGSVDFKQLNLIKNVEKDDLLVEVIPATEGISGKNIFGHEVPPKRGKEIPLKIGKNTKISKDGLKLYAATSGQAYSAEGKINVSEVYEILGNVDHSTGNIKFNGRVVVRGNVKAGFVIEAEGSVEIHGVVEGAYIKAQGDIIIGRGVQGNNQAYLECTGNLIAKYIENASIRSLGNIEADCILHSEVVASGKILVTGKKGLVVGGDIRAGEEVRAKILGSPMGTITKIEVGCDPVEKIRSEKIKKELENIEKNLDHLRKTMELLHRMNKNNQLPQSKQEILVKSIKTYEVLKQNHNQLSKELRQIELHMQALAKGKIHCSHTIHPGVRAIISTSTRHIYDSLANCTLFRKEGEITIGPYEK